MNFEQIRDFVERLKGRVRNNKRRRRLLGDLGKESLEDRFERYDFDHKERELQRLLKRINYKEDDLESCRRIRRETTIDSFDTSNPILVSRINRLDNKIKELEDEINDLRIIYEDERRKLDTLRTIVRGPKERKLEQLSELDSQNRKKINIPVVQEEVEQNKTTGVEIIPDNQEKEENVVKALEELKQKLETETVAPNQPTVKTTSNSFGQTPNIPNKPTINIPTITSGQTPNIPNSQDPDYLKLIASDKMSEFARGYRMVKREERHTRTCKFLGELYTAAGIGMVTLSSAFSYALAAYDLSDGPIGPISFWETIINDVTQKLSSDPSFENIVNTLGHGPVQFLFGAVCLGVGFNGYFRYRRQYNEAHARRIDMENINAVTEAPTTESIARHI